MNDFALDIENGRTDSDFLNKVGTGVRKIQSKQMEWGSAQRHFTELKHDVSRNPGQKAMSQNIYEDDDNINVRTRSSSNSNVYEDVNVIDSGTHDLGNVYIDESDTKIGHKYPILPK